MFKRNHGRVKFNKLSKEFIHTASALDSIERQAAEGLKDLTPNDNNRVSQNEIYREMQLVLLKRVQGLIQSEIDRI